MHESNVVHKTKASELVALMHKKCRGLMMLAAVISNNADSAARGDVYN